MRTSRSRRQLEPWPGMAYGLGHTALAAIVACRIPKATAMKPDIHPAYHDLTVVMTDGTTFKTRTTGGKPDATLRLDIDPKSHPAWTGVQRIMDTGGQVAKFNKKFAGIGLKKG